MKKIALLLVAFLVFIIVAFLIFVLASSPKNYNSEYPVKDLTITPDSARLARGQYLVYGPAHCGHCHVPADKLAAFERGEKVAMTGGFGLDIEPGTMYAPNITPDAETGIGRYSDGQLYRMLRYNITPAGHAAFDFMPFINMTDEDIYSIIAFLRSQKPVKHEMQPVKLSFLGKIIYATEGVKPGVPDPHIPETVEENSSKEYGKYLAYAVANCRGCHTNRNMKTGEYIGPAYAGGLVFGPDNLTSGWKFITPNLTPDVETGVMAGWTEDQFVSRMKKGRIHEFSPMPWTAVQFMKETDLRAIYRYLHTLPPVKNKIDPVAIKVKN